MRKFLLVLVFLTLSFNVALKAQTDTLFWFVAPEVSQGLGDRPIMLYFNTYAQASTVTVTLPAHGTIAPIIKNIAANSLDSVDLTSLIDSVENSPANTVNNQGILIQATKNISGYYMVKSGANKEIFTLKGQKGIGKEFFTPFQEIWDMGVTAPVSFSSIEIVATQNNTTILITPRKGHLQGTSFAITLNKGQTYSAQNTSAFKDSSLAGSIISSNNPIAVTVYSGAVSNGGCKSTMGDQLTNSSYIGSSYVVNQGGANSDGGVFVLATQNNTAITFNDGTNTYSNTINSSETDTFRITQPLTYISSTKPIYVWHVTGYGCMLSAAQVPAIYCSGTYSVAFNRATNDSFAVNLYTRNGFENNFLVNGTGGLIPGAAFNPVPGTSGNIVSARIYFTPAQIASGTQNIISNTGDIFGCAIHNGSSTSGAGYGYISEFTSHPFIDAGPATATVCSNSNIILNGLIGGGNVQGVWSTNALTTPSPFVSGTGALSNSFQPQALDTLIKPLLIILTSVGPCTQLKDTIILTVTPQPMVNAGADQIMCASNPTVTLAGDVTLGANTGIWSLGTGIFTPNNTILTPVYTASNIDTAAGQVTLVLTSTNNGGCQAVTDTMKITITNAAGVNAGPTTTSVCANNAAVTLTGSLSGSGTSAKWTSSGTGNFTPSNLQLNATYNPSPSDITSGQVALKLTTTNNGQCKVVEDTILVTFTTPPLVNAGVDWDACVNTPTVTLNGNIGGATTTGIWSGGAGTFAPNNTTLNATYNPTPAEIANGLVLLTLTSSNNGTCLSANDAVQINFIAKPFANFSFINTCLSIGSSFTDFSLPSSGSLSSWSWNFGDAVTSTAQSPAHTYTVSSNYTVTLIVKNSFNCYDTVKKSLTIYPLPNANFGITRNCSGSGLNLSFHDSTSITPSDTISSWSWDFGGLGNSTQQNPTKTYPNAPSSIFYNVTLIVMSNHNCKDTAHQSFNLSPLAQAGFYYSFNQGQSVGTSVNFVDTSKNAVSWNYDFGDNPPGTSNTQDPIYLYYSNGNYIVTQVVHDAYGCTDTARKVVKINNVTNEITQLIPNAISPNGDGKNDIWHLDFIKSFYPNALIEIFNRWGEKVFSNVGYSTPWDGTFNGHPLPVAAYYYIVTLNDSKYPNPFKGSVLLIR